MNLTLRKLALLEKSIAEKEETARINGYTTNVSDVEMKKNITELLNRVRVI